MLRLQQLPTYSEFYGNSSARPTDCPVKKSINMNLLFSIIFVFAMTTEGHSKKQLSAQNIKMCFYSDPIQTIDCKFIAPNCFCHLIFIE